VTILALLARIELLVGVGDTALATLGGGTISPSHVHV
jgi:hypothetical protein